MTLTDPPVAVLGFIGLGVMGSLQCLNVSRHSGLPLMVFDIEPAKMAPLVASGARPGASVGEVGQHADLILLSLPGGHEVASVLYEDGGLLQSARPGALIVDLSTTPVAIVREAHRRLAERGLGFLDAPVARTRRAAADGTLAIMAGGTADNFARAEPVLHMMGTDVTHCGPPGAGSSSSSCSTTPLSLRRSSLWPKRSRWPAEVVSSPMRSSSTSSGPDQPPASRSRTTGAPRCCPMRTQPAHSPLHTCERMSATRWTSPPSSVSTCPVRPWRMRSSVASATRGTLTTTTLQSFG